MSEAFCLREFLKQNKAIILPALGVAGLGLAVLLAAKGGVNIHIEISNSNLVNVRIKSGDATKSITNSSVGPDED